MLFEFSEAIVITSTKTSIACLKARAQGFNQLYKLKIGKFYQKNL